MTPTQRPCNFWLSIPYEPGTKEYATEVQKVTGGHVVCKDGRYYVAPNPDGSFDVEVKKIGMTDARSVVLKSIS